MDSYSEAASLVRSVRDAPVVTVVVTTTIDANVAAGSKAKDNLDTETLHRVYVPRWKVTNDSVLDDSYVCRDMTHPEAMEAISLRGQLAALKAADASKSAKFSKLTADLSGFQLSRDELNSKVASLESERDCLVTQEGFLLLDIRGPRLSRCATPLPLPLVSLVHLFIFPYFLPYNTCYADRWAKAKEMPNLLNAFSFLFSPSGYLFYKNSWKVLARFFTFSKYLIMLDSFAKYTSLTSLATSLESTFAWRFCTPIFLAMRRPTNRASYSASLLVALNLNLRAWVNSIPSVFMIIKPAPEPSMHGDPFVNNTHGSGSSSLSSIGVSDTSSSWRSTMKSARICPFTDFLGLYWMSCSSNSNLYLSNLPITSGFDNSCFIGCYLILKEDDLIQRQQEEINKITSVLSVSNDYACMLLLKYNWRVTTIYEAWFGDEVKVRVGLLDVDLDLNFPPKGKKKVGCGICFQSVRFTDTANCGCGHVFCRVCWTSYVKTAINDGPRCMTLKCPEPSCHVAVSPGMVNVLVEGKEKRKYDMFWFRSYVESNNKKIKWCPSPGCDYAVEFDDNFEEDYNVTCDCKYAFCWKCMEDAHSPLDCETVRKWMFQNKDESGNITWILAYTKPCPSCRKPIEKNHGCMHMTYAQPCGHEFCWLCLAPYTGNSSHFDSTCNAYRREGGEVSNSEQRRESARETLQRHAHYYERWDANEKSRKRALLDFNKIETEYLKKLSSNYNMPEKKLQFVTDAWLQIVECRRVLKWTYAYGFYIPEKEKEKKALFEFLQGQAESGALVGQGSALIACLRIRTLFRRRPTEAVRVRLVILEPLLDFVVPLDFASATGGFSVTLLINQATRLGFLLLYFTMSTIRDIKSKLNQKALDALCTKYHIPASVHPSLPGSDKSILQSPDGKIGVYSRFFDFANYRLPLSQFLVDVLGHFRIHLSQLSVFVAAKVSHFEILCRDHRFHPSVNLFRAFYTSSYTKGWLSFIKRSDAAPVCYSKPLDFVKNWNDHFFWVDSMVFPLSVSLKSKILSKDPPPKLSHYESEARKFLRTHTAPFRKFSEPFLCWVGISRYYTLDENSYPTFWDGDEEMDLFAFIRHSDPTKVRVGERDLADRELKLLKMTEGRTVALDPPATAENSAERDDVQEEVVAKDDSEVVVEKPQKKRKRKVIGDASSFALPPKRLRDDYQSLPFRTGGKSLTAFLSIVPDDSIIPSDATRPAVTASVTPTPDVETVDSVSELNLRTRPSHVRHVVSSDSSLHLDSYSEAASLVRSVADAPVVTVAVTTTIDANIAAGSKAKDVLREIEHTGDSASAGRLEADAVSISKLKQPSISSDSFYASQSLDTETLHRVYVPRWKVTNDSVLDDPYVCRDMTDRAEVRMRAEHTVEKKNELEDKCAGQANLLSKRDTEIAHLKSLLSLKEAEAMEAISLRGQLAALKAADASKSAKVRALKEKNFALEGEKNALCERVEALESVAASKEIELTSLSSQVSKLTADLSGFQLSRDELNSKVASLESERDCLVTQRSSLKSSFEFFKGQVEKMQDEHVGVLIDRFTAIDSDLMKITLHMDAEFYPRYLTTIAGRR
ncbi:zinc finger, C6HC-type containing protein [Tanacetum coccineum]